MTRSYSSVTSYLIFIKARKVIRSSSVLFCFSFNYANVDPHFPFMVFISVMKFTHLVADTCKLTDVRVFNLHFFPLILKCGISLSNFNLIISFAVFTRVCFSTPDTFSMALRCVTLIITRIRRTVVLHFITLKVKSRLSMYLHLQKMSSQSKR